MQPKYAIYSESDGFYQNIVDLDGEVIYFTSLWTGAHYFDSAESAELFIEKHLAAFKGITIFVVYQCVPACQQDRIV